MATLYLSSLSILSASVLRRMCKVLASVFVMELAMAAPVSSADQTCPPNPKPGCFTQASRDIAFLIDRSGSIAHRGQTYNIEIEGVIGALRDATVIPRNGSVAVVVVLFNETATLAVPLTQIDSEADAQKVAEAVAALKCNDPGCQLLTRPTLPGTNYTMAIKVAGRAISQGRSLNPKPGAHRVLLMSSDGQPDDPDFGAGAVEAERHAAAILQIPFEMDVILMGLARNSQELVDSQARTDMIVTPKPATDLPGATLLIEAGPANQTGASAGGVDFFRQASEFAALTRTIMRSDVQAISLVVTTNLDSDPDTPPANGLLSLRQAIERGNCNGGKATITFDESVKNKTISPRTPLPALTAPDMTIDGIDKCDIQKCDKCDEPTCVPSVTIDGSHIDVSAGEAHRDGILIRSNHDVVRGLKIVSFKRAGVAVAPLCLSDNVGGNRIELNVLTNNPTAGVLILDPDSSQESIVAHNVGNAISRNAISGSATPIDLGGDGPTPNDPDDTDEGPNTLLNFPIIDSTTPTGDTATLKGRAAAGQVIEIFRISRTETGSAERLIEAVEFIKTITADLIDGTFSAAELPVSPTGRYTATAADPLVSDFQCRNTSELTPICTALAQARITLEDDQSVLDFVSALARSKPKKKRAPVETLVRTFTIANVGCETLKVRGLSIQRTGSAVGSRIIDADDSRFFSVANPDGATLVFPMMIPPGDQKARTFSVRFHPVIPPVASGTSGLAASQVLPSRFTSVIKIRLDGEGDQTVPLSASVGTAVQLINSNGGESEPLTLTRSGDKVTVTYSVYDSDLSVDKVEYEFRDARGNPVSAGSIEGDLRTAIKNHQPPLVTGQSFTVIQDILALKNPPDGLEVKVTVSDGEAQATASAKLVSQSNQALSAQSLRERRSAVLILPPAHPLAVAKKSLLKSKATRLKKRPAGLEYWSASGAPLRHARREQR
ncbi:MAG: hypothetical protein V7641_240 [Blastocatellia bacterium]